MKTVWVTYAGRVYCSFACLMEDDPPPEFTEVWEVGQGVFPQLQVRHQLGERCWVCGGKLFVDRSSQEAYND